MRALTDIRAEIDAIDDEVIALLARRFALLPQVVAYKRAQGLPAVIPARVDEVILRNIARGDAARLPAGLAEKIYTEIVRAMCEAEEKLLHTPDV